jgi:uncharacterized protein YraI
MQLNKTVLKAGLVGAAMLVTAGAALAAPGFATANVNVRSGPGSNYSAVDTLRRGEPVQVSGCRSGWCFVEKAGQDGWVSANYLNAARAPSQPVIRFQFNFGNPPRYVAPRHQGPRHDWERDRRGDDRWDRRDRDRNDWHRRDRDGWEGDRR